MALHESPDPQQPERDAVTRDGSVPGLSERLLSRLAGRLAAATGAERVVMAVADAVADLLDAAYVRIAVDRGADSPEDDEPECRPLLGTSGQRPEAPDDKLRALVIGPSEAAIGEIHVVSKHTGTFGRADAQNLVEIGRLVGTLLANAAAEPNLSAQAEGAFVALAAALDTHDEYMEGHAGRVAAICEVLGRDLGLDELRLILLRGASAVYDCGTLTTPDVLLHKPEPLTAGEILAIQHHVHRTLEILRRIQLPPELDDVRAIAAQHHERYDGTGYPLGLRGEAILLEARILAVADVMDAMMSERPHRPALPAAAVLAYIRQGRGRLFDPAVIDTLDLDIDRVLAVWETAP